MAGRLRREIGLIVAWLVFPLVPVVLEDWYYQICAFSLDSRWRFGPDPREWDWFLWVVMIGPLLGYGFLAGATADVPDDDRQGRRGWRWLAARRSVWVATGPWWGPLVLFAIWFGCGFLNGQFPALQTLAVPEPTSIKGTWAEPVLAWISGALAWVGIAFVAVIWAYGWLWPAWAALRRAARIGRLRRALYRGLAIALAFVGSLFGSFWAATSLWRSYFFDPRVMPLIVAAVGLSVTSGRGESSPKGGDVRVLAHSAQAFGCRPAGAGTLRK